MTVRFGIVGTGTIAHYHAIAMKDEARGCELTACTDIVEKKSLDFAVEYQISSFENFDEMLNHVDAICVCTPPPTHADITIAAAKKGVHVLCEKPMATTLSDADAVEQAVIASGITYSVVSQRRWFPAAQAVKRAIEDGKLGSRVILGEVTTENLKGPLDFGRAGWRKTWRGAGGGVLINQCPHSIDLLLWYMGIPNEVFAYCANFTHPEGELEDNLVAVMKFDKAFATLRASLTPKPVLKDHSIVLTGNSGHRVSLDIPTFAEGRNDIWTIGGDTPFPALSHSNFHAYQIQDFTQAITTKRPPRVTVDDGWWVVAVIEAIYGSALSGHPITVGEAGG